MRVTKQRQTPPAAVDPVDPIDPADLLIMRLAAQGRQLAKHPAPTRRVLHQSCL